MWTCPKCKREFKNNNQSHFCGKVENVDDYLKSQEKEVQPILQKLRETIKSVAPEVQETIKWSMPYFTVKGKNLCGFAAQKKHISFFPSEETVGAFEEQLKNYKFAKGTVQLSYDTDLNVELIEQMVRFTLHNLNVE